MSVKFYRPKEQFGCFSNFSRHGIELDGKYWPTTEHYFQAQKFAGTEFEEKVRLTQTPREVANMGRDRSLPLRKDWEQVKDSIMTRAVLKKVQTHDIVKKALLSTSHDEIIEDSPIDYYWGCGANGTGKNMLGKILVEIRNTIRTVER